MKDYVEPVYPKEDPEYRRKVMEAFYKLVRETKWDDEPVKKKYRFPKLKKRIETKPRTVQKERQLSGLNYLN